MSEIHKTADYSVFRMVNTNRIVNKKHVARLKKSIAGKNLLELNPIIVNGDMDVIDGQHRLQAAKELKTPIYYMFSNKVTQEDIATLNTNKLNWNIHDYINYYAKNGNQAYKQLKIFLDQHSYIPPSSAIRILCDGVKTQHIRDGELRSVDFDKADKLMKVINAFRNYTSEAYTRTFISAVKQVIELKGYDHARMIKKLSAQPKSLVPCISIKQYVSVLETIYNYHSQDRLRFY